MKELNEKTYVNLDNIVKAEQIGNNYIVTTVNGNQLNVDEQQYNEIKAYQRGGGGGGTTVVANPELVGDEDTLTGLQVGTTKYKVDAGIPTITIVASQMIDETHAQLTNEQFEIIENNGFINVIFPNGTSCGFNRFVDGYEGYHLAMCSGDTSEIMYFTASIDSTTKIATIVIGDFNGGSTVEANPTLAGTEASLTGLQVGDTKYKVEQPTTIVANPDPAGETELTGLQIGDTKYKVGGGKQLYRHVITFASSNDHYTIKTDVINDSDTVFTKESFSSYIKSKGFNDSTKLYPCCGVQSYSSKLLMYYGMFVYGNDSYPTCMSMNSTGEDNSGAMTYASFSDTVIAL